MAINSASLTQRSLKEFVMTMTFVLTAVSVAVCLRIWLDQFDLQSPFILFYPTIALCSWYKRFRAGFLALLLSTLAANFFFQEPEYSFRLNNDEDVLALYLFVMVGLVIISLIQLLHKARETAEQAKHRLEEVFETMSDAVVILDAFGKFTYVNPRAERMLLKSKNDLLHRSFWNEFPDIGGSAFKIAIHEASESGNSSTLELYASLLERWLEARIYPSENATTIYLNDITSRKEAENTIKRLNEELELKVQKRTKALQEATDNIESFTYSVAHDLRAPLRAISGFTQMLMDDHARTLEPAAIHYLDRIIKASSRMDRLILDLLAFIQISREDYAPEHVNLDSIMERTLNSMQKMIRETHAKVELTRPLGFVGANEHALSISIENLLSNAIKFSRPEATPVIRIHAHKHGNSIRLNIEDNGIGIPPQYQEKIFGVFQYLERTGDLKGTGIGLALVKKAVEKMEGTVGLHSVPGNGSCFWIELPGLECEASGSFIEPEASALQSSSM